jgi:hypothetical protein
MPPDTERSSDEPEVQDLDETAFEPFRVYVGVQAARVIGVKSVRAVTSRALTAEERGDVVHWPATIDGNHGKTNIFLASWCEDIAGRERRGTTARAQIYYLPRRQGMTAQAEAEFVHLGGVAGAPAGRPELGEKPARLDPLDDPEVQLDLARRETGVERLRVQALEAQLTQAQREISRLRAMVATAQEALAGSQQSVVAAQQSVLAAMEAQKTSSQAVNRMLTREMVAFGENVESAEGT